MIPVGFEPTTCWVRASYSSQLSYETVRVFLSWGTLPRDVCLLKVRPITALAFMVGSAGFEPASHRLRAECVVTANTTIR